MGCGASKPVSNVMGEVDGEGVQNAQHEINRSDPVDAGLLTIRIEKVTNLPRRDGIIGMAKGTMNPLVVFECGPNSVQTQGESADRETGMTDSFESETLELEIPQGALYFAAAIYDKDLITANDFLGVDLVALDQFEDMKEVDFEFTLDVGLDEGLEEDEIPKVKVSLQYETNARRATALVVGIPDDATTDDIKEAFMGLQIYVDHVALAPKDGLTKLHETMNCALVQFSEISNRDEAVKYQGGMGIRVKEKLVEGVEPALRSIEQHEKIEAEDREKEALRLLEEERKRFEEEKKRLEQEKKEQADEAAKAAKAAKIREMEAAVEAKRLKAEAAKSERKRRAEVRKRKKAESNTVGAKVGGVVSGVKKMGGKVGRRMPKVKKFW